MKAVDKYNVRYKIPKVRDPLLAKLAKAFRDHWERQALTRIKHESK